MIIYTVDTYGGLASGNGPKQPLSLQAELALIIGPNLTPSNIWNMFYFNLPMCRV